MEALNCLRTLDQALAALVEQRKVPVHSEYGELLDRMIAGLEAEIDIRTASRVLRPALKVA